MVDIGIVNCQSKGIFSISSATNQDIKIIIDYTAVMSYKLDVVILVAILNKNASNYMQFQEYTDSKVLWEEINGKLYQSETRVNLG